MLRSTEYMEYHVFETVKYEDKIDHRSIHNLL